MATILDRVTAQHLFNVLKGIRERNRDLAIAIAEADGEDAQPLDSKLERLRKLRVAPFPEVRALKAYIDEQILFSTKRGVKGAEFDNVVAVLSQSWQDYDFAARRTPPACEP